MSVTTTPEVQTTTEAPKPTAPAVASKSDELPDWARQQITDANNEAAAFRVQLKEAKTARKELEDQVAALASEKAASVGSLSSIQSDFDRLVTAIKAEVPHQHVFAFAKTLQGANEEELAAHATELKNMFGTPGPSPAVDRFQGQGSGPSKSDPASEFAALLKSQLSK